MRRKEPNESQGRTCWAVVESQSPVCLFETSWTGACRAPLSSTISQGLLKFMSIELVMLSNHLILCHPLLLLPSIFPSIRIFSNESAHKFTYIFIPSLWILLSTFLISHPSRYHRVPDWAPSVILKLPTSYLFYAW